MATFRALGEDDDKSRGDEASAASWSALRADFKHLARHVLANATTEDATRPLVAGHAGHFDAAPADDDWIRKRTNLREAEFYERGDWPAQYLPRYGGRYATTTTAETCCRSSTAAARPSLLAQGGGSADDDDPAKATGIILEDVTVGFRRPCVMDVKLGTTTAAERDARFKKLRLGLTDTLTGTKTTGARIVGFSAYHPRRPRDHTPKKTTTTTGPLALSGRRALLAAIRYDPLSLLAFYLSDGARLRGDVVAAFRAKIADLVRLFETRTDYVFVGSSLLFVYDAKPPRLLDVRVALAHRAAGYRRERLDSLRRKKTTSSSSTKVSDAKGSPSADPPSPRVGMPPSCSSTTPEEEESSSQETVPPRSSSPPKRSTTVSSFSVSPPWWTTSSDRRRRSARTQESTQQHHHHHQRPPDLCRLVMIDFAKTRRQEGDDRRVDEGYLTGLRTLRDHLETLAATVELHGPKLAAWPEATWQGGAATEQPGGDAAASSTTTTTTTTPAAPAGGAAAAAAGGLPRDGASNTTTSSGDGAGTTTSAAPSATKCADDARRPGVVVGHTRHARPPLGTAPSDASTVSSSGSSANPLDVHNPRVHFHTPSATRPSGVAEGDEEVDDDFEDPGDDDDVDDDDDDDGDKGRPQGNSESVPSRGERSGE